jgi:anti-sigma regulatory factor (Ser/Thr protein kinase)
MVTGAGEELAFTIEELGALRALVARVAARASLETARTYDLVLAVSELASNSVLHGGGEGVLRIWVEDQTLQCEVRDRGHIRERARAVRCPPAAQHDGRGLWLADRLCDGLRISSSPATGCSVRVHMRLSA